MSNKILKESDNQIERINKMLEEHRRKKALLSNEKTDGSNGNISVLSNKIKADNELISKENKTCIPFLSELIIVRMNNLQEESQYFSESKQKHLSSSNSNQSLNHNRSSQITPPMVSKASQDMFYEPSESN